MVVILKFVYVTVLLLSLFLMTTNVNGKRVFSLPKKRKPHKGANQNPPCRNNTQCAPLICEEGQKGGCVKGACRCVWARWPHLA